VKVGGCRRPLTGTLLSGLHRPVGGDGHLHDQGSVGKAAWEVWRLAWCVNVDDGQRLQAAAWANHDTVHPI
jgi:hypothetical protein